MYKIINVKHTSTACPSQWEATLSDGRMLYFRYRWGYLSVRISDEKTDDVMDAVDGKEIFGKELDKSGWDGQLSYKKLQELTKHLIEYPGEDILPCEPTPHEMTKELREIFKNNSADFTHKGD